MHNSIINTVVVKNQSKDGFMTLESRIDDIIHAHAKYDRYSDCYQLSYSDLNDFDQQELAAIVMVSNDHYASEATGPDNPQYDIKMLPALISYLRNPLDKDLHIEFVEAWREGVSSYFESYISNVLADRLCDYNTDKLGRTSWVG